MAQDRRYDLTGPGSEGDPQLGSMSTQPPVVPVIPGTPVPPVVSPPPSTNGTGGGKSPFSENAQILAHNVFDPNTPTSVLGTNPNVPIPIEQQLEKLT